MEKDGKIKFWIQRVNRWICYVGMFLILPLMLFTTADVIGRAVWARPIPGIVELSSYVLDVFILLGLAYTQQVKGHVRVSMLTSRKHKDRMRVRACGLPLTRSDGND